MVLGLIPSKTGQRQRIHRSNAIGPEELVRLLVDRAAEHPRIDLCREPPTTGRSPNIADNLPPTTVESELLAGLDLFLDGYLGGAAVGVLERKKRGHTIYIGSSRRERERDRRSQREGL